MNNTSKKILYILFGLSSCAIYKLLSYISSNYKQKDKRKEIERKVKEYLQKRKEKIDNFLLNEAKEVSNELRKEIISLKSIEALSSKIKLGLYSVRQVVISFLYQSLTIGISHNLVADFNIEEILRIAKERDEELKETIDKSKLSSIYGIPFSIKDNIKIKGFLSTIGYSHRVNSEIDTEDSYLVKVIKEKGGIPLLKANIPQGLLIYTSENFIFGRAENPWNNSFITGGSSGGDAGLVSSLCVMSGIGSDLGGSIRIPSSFCGVYGLKPSIRRISKMGNRSLDGTEYFSLLESSSYGPISKNPYDIETICKEMFNSFKNDYQVYNKSYLEKEEVMIKIGVVYDVDSYETCDAIKSAISNVITKLKQRNISKYHFEEIDLNKFIHFSEHEETFSLVQRFSLSVINSGSLDIVLDSTKDEKIHPGYIEYKYILSSGIWKWVYMKYLQFKNEKRLVNILKSYVLFDNIHQFNLNKAKLNKQKEEFFRFLNEKSINCIILPNHIIPCSNKESSITVGVINRYQLLGNVCDLPAASVPIGVFTNSEYNPIVKDLLTNEISRTLKQSHGLPLSLQIMTLPYKEELLIEIMKDIYDLNVYTHEDSLRIMQKFNN